MSIEKIRALLKIAETKCLCTDDRLQPLKEIRQALALLSSEPELNKKDIPLPSTDYLRVQADFCEEHIGLDDFMRSIAYDLKRAANEIDRLTSEYEGCDLIDRLKSELAEAARGFVNVGEGD